MSVFAPFTMLYSVQKEDSPAEGMGEPWEVEK